MGKRLETSIQDFPPEILEYIFLRLDGWSLARVQRVCKQWQGIIRNLHSFKNVWEQKCLSEIGEDLMIDIGSTSNSKKQQLDTYKQWFVTRHIGKWPILESAFLTFENNPVSCVKLAGSIIVTGHRNGYVSWWNSSTGILQGVVWIHHQLVTDMIILSLPLEGELRHYIVSTSLDQTIQVTTIKTSDTIERITTSVCLSHHSDSVMSLSGFQNMFAAHSSDQTISVWRVTSTDKEAPKPIRIKLETVIHKPRYQEKFCWMGLWKDQIFCINANSSMRFYNLSSNTWRREGYNAEILANDTDDLEEMSVRQAFVFRQTIVVCLSVDKYIFISVDGRKFRRYNPFYSLHTTVLSVCIKGNLLALGTENGCGYMYHFDRDEDLLNLDLSLPAWSDKLSEGSIISVDIGNDGYEPLVVLTTTEAVYVRKWTTPLMQPLQSAIEDK